MASLALDQERPVPRTRLSARVRALPRTPLVVAAVLALTAAATVKHLHALGAPYWIDEGISVGVASHHLTDIPGVLRQDGSPPLYYVLLHLWIGLFGAGSVATHSLSAIFAIACVPAAYWAIAPLSRSGGIVAAAILALDPYVGLYADETRMYSLVLLLSVLVVGAFLRAFVLRRPSAAFALAVLLALILYTHAWGAFLAASAGLCWLALVALGPQRRLLLRSGVIAFGGALLLYVPWVPTLLYQARHTGAPWSHRPNLRSLDTAMTRIWSGQRAELILLAAGAVGLAFALWRDGGRMRRGVLGIVVLTAGTLLGAWAYSRYGSPAWALRYLVVVVGPLALLVGLGLGRIPVLGPVSVLAVLAVGWLLWYGRPTDRTLNHKSNVAAAAAVMRPSLPSGTLVFSTQPEQVPNLAHYLPAGMRYMTPLGRVPDVGVFDWRDALVRLRAARYDRVLGPAVAHMRRGQRLLLVQPQFSHPDSPWTIRIRDLARHWGRQVRRDHRLRRLKVFRSHHGSSRSTVVETLLVRR
ncbi:MAG: glycosyltransferase family 39 protein [Solirubrobacteraceae bacterium]